jgi:hypothetical protein
LEDTVNVQFGIVKTTAGFYVWIVLGMLEVARSGRQIEIHNLTGEEI